MRRICVRPTYSASLRVLRAPRRFYSSLTSDSLIPKPAPSAGPRIILPNDVDLKGASPVSEAEFSAAMEPLRINKGQALALGVSGGPDSMSLVLLLRRWAKTAGVRLVGITVDHRFREESAHEAKLVSEWLHKLDIEHVSRAISWERNMTPGQRLNLARVERYRLLVNEAKEHKADTLCVAHHKDDQIETFLMRFSLMSGLDGLGCMGARRHVNLFPLVRPLLSFSKAQLRATCASFQQPYVEDPSNEYQYQLRNRSRLFVSKVAERGFDTNDLIPVIEHIDTLRESAAEKVEQFLSFKFLPDPALGHGATRRSFLRQLPTPILQRVLVRLIMYYGGRVYPPSLSSVNTLIQRIKSDDTDFPAYTTANCYVFQDTGRAPTLFFATEALSRKYKSIPIASGQTVTVDNVWHISYSHVNNEPASVVYLDGKNWSTVLRQVPRLMELQRYPARCRVLPIVVSADGNTPLAIPYEGIYTAKGVTAKCVFRAPLPLLRNSLDDDEQR